MSKTIRIDPEVRAALDRVRDQYGDTNCSDAIRRVLRWKRIVESKPSAGFPGGDTAA